MVEKKEKNKRDHLLYVIVGMLVLLVLQSYFAPKTNNTNTEEALAKINESLDGLDKSLDKGVDKSLDKNIQALSAKLTELVDSEKIRHSEVLVKNGENLSAQVEVFNNHIKNLSAQMDAQKAMLEVIFEKIENLENSRTPQEPTNISVTNQNKGNSSPPSTPVKSEQKQEQNTVAKYDFTFAKKLLTAKQIATCEANAKSITLRHIESITLAGRNVGVGDYEKIYLAKLKREYEKAIASGEIVEPAKTGNMSARPTSRSGLRSHK